MQPSLSIDMWRFWYTDDTGYEVWVCWENLNPVRQIKQKRELEFQCDVDEGFVAVWAREVCLQWDRYIIDRHLDPLFNYVSPAAADGSSVVFSPWQFRVVHGAEWHRRR